MLMSLRNHLVLKSWKTSFTLPLVSLLKIIIPRKFTRYRMTLLTDYRISPFRLLQWSSCCTFTHNMIRVNKNVKFFKTEVNWSKRSLYTPEILSPPLLPCTRKTLFTSTDWYFSTSLLYLFEAGSVPFCFMSREGSLKSTSNISKVAFVLKDASSCWADVPSRSTKAEQVGTILKAQDTKKATHWKPVLDSQHDLGCAHWRRGHVWVQQKEEPTVTTKTLKERNLNLSKKFWAPWSLLHKYLSLLG